MCIFRLRQEWKWLAGVVIVVWLGLSPTPGLAVAPTLPLAGVAFFDLNQVGQEPVPFDGLFEPVVGSCGRPLPFRGSCSFNDPPNGEGSEQEFELFWLWETTITNTGPTSILSLPISFSAAGRSLGSVLLSLSPGSTVLFDVVVDDSPPEVGSWTWIANVSGVNLKPFSIDTAIVEIASPPEGRLPERFFTGLDDNVITLTDPVAGGIEFCNVEGMDANAPCGFAPVPEPSTLLLFATGLVGLVWRWGRRGRFMAPKSAR